MLGCAVGRATDGIHRRIRGKVVAARSRDRTILRRTFQLPESGHVELSCIDGSWATTILGGRSVAPLIGLPGLIRLPGSTYLRTRGVVRDLPSIRTG